LQNHPLHRFDPVSNRPEMCFSRIHELDKYLVNRGPNDLFLPHHLRQLTPRGILLASLLRQLALRFWYDTELGVEEEQLHASVQRVFLAVSCRIIQFLAAVVEREVLTATVGHAGKLKLRSIEFSAV